MKFDCPYCRKELDLMELQLDADLNAIIRMMPAFGGHAHIVMGYCYLFGVSPLKLKAKKLRILLEEMKRLFDAEAFSFEKRKYAITRQGIAEALDIVVKREFANLLHNHNYLKQVMIGISERERGEASRRSEKDLRKKEAQIMAGGERGQAPEAQRDRYVSPEAKECCSTDDLPEDVKAGIADLKNRLGIERGLSKE